jgi:hypothetical protein
MSSLPNAGQPSPYIQPSAASTTPWSRKLDSLLFAIVALAAGYVFCLLSYSLYAQLHTYAAATARAMSDPKRGDIVVLAFTRAADFAIIKTSVVFLGFILAFIGALYVLRTATASFSMTVKTGTAGGSLATSSPGLVMIALGVVTVNCALFARTSVDIDALKNLPSIEVVPPPGNSPSAKKQDTVVLPPFPKGSSELSKEQKDILNSLSGRLQGDPNLKIQLAEQTDSTDSTELNMALADRRTAVVRLYLSAMQAQDRVTVMSQGKESPHVR